MSSDSNDAATAPWADLLPELCNLVLDRVDVVDVIRFPAVCAGWAAASKDTHHRPRLPSGAPTLLTSRLEPEDEEGYAYADIEYNVEPGTFGLHDVATGKSYRGEAEGLKKRTWVGGKDDWLVTTDLWCNVELLNPITGVRVPLPSFTTTGVRVPLPSITTIPGVKAMEFSNDDHPSVSFDKSWCRYSGQLRKVMLCRTPAHPSGYLAVALFSLYESPGLVAYTVAGDEQWTLLKNPERSRLFSIDNYIDVIVHKGKVLAVTRYGNIWSWDMDGGTAAEPTVLPRPPDTDTDSDYYVSRVYYLATSCGGDLQLVCMFGDKDDTGKDRRGWRMIVFDIQWSFWPRRVLLHELDAVTGAWRRVLDHGGARALFIGANYPFYVEVPRDGSRDNLLRENCVYVADLINCEAGIFDLKLGYDFEFNRDARLSYPAPSDSLQMPMWFRPTAALSES